MRHLYHSRVEVLRLSGTLVNGTPVLSWAKVTDTLDSSLGVPGELVCRIDLNFVRLGKDAPMPVVAGRAPDRMGVCFFDADSGPASIKAGDRLHCLSGPVTGTFEIRAIPDAAIDFASAHHLEVQVVEVSQQLTNVFPGASVEE